MLGTSAQTVSRLISSHELPARKVGNRWVIARDDVSRYLAAHNLSAVPRDHTCRRPLPGPVALSFFSGALGLDLGMEQAGIHASLYCENDRKCRMTIDTMRPDVALIGDIGAWDAADILRMAGIENGQVDIMFGGPPCQAFSTAGARRAFDDARGNVFLKYLELVRDIRPTYVVIENVRGLLSTAYPLSAGEKPVKGGALQIVLDHLADAGYAVSFNLYNAANYGAPQIRERVVLIGKLGEKRVPYLSPTHAQGGSFGLKPWRTFEDAIRGLEGPLHASSFPEKRLKYFKLLHEGQYWKDLPQDVQEEAMGKAYRLSGGKTGFYRRIRFDRPCPTLVTSPTMPATDLCHPTEDRPLAIEEYRRVQGFPDSWIIRGDLHDQYRQIGNAVPVALGAAIGNTIMHDIAGEAQPPAPEGFPFSRYRHTSDATWISPKSA